MPAQTASSLMLGKSSERSAKRPHTVKVPAKTAKNSATRNR
jgi:hypothetical protein